VTQTLILASVCFVSIITGVQAEVLLSKDATGHVTVPAFVNGTGPFPFILNTGADQSAVYSWFAKSLRLAKGANRMISGATGSAQAAGTRISTLSIDGHIIRNIDVDTVPDRADGVRIAGVAGCRSDDASIGRH
jgi:predicted aspartyl protease